MYVGKIVEMGDADKVYEHPQVDYTQALLAAVPVADPVKMRVRREDRKKHKHVLAEPV